MQYILCPRCNFKMSATCRLCSTCGYQIPRVVKDSSTSEVMETRRKPSALSRFFGFNRPDHESGESGAEKPALG